MARKTFTVLENNPEVMNFLGRQLGLSDSLSFYDVYSLDADGVAHIPRPALALLVIIPRTPAWDADRRAEDAVLPAYIGPPSASAGTTTNPSDNNSTVEEPVIWFPQTIGEACGSIGLIHCTLNGAARASILPGTFLADTLAAARPLSATARAQLLYDSAALETAHQAAAPLGDTDPGSYDVDDPTTLGQHFVAFVKGGDGHLWELEGSRTGPLDRGLLGDGDDVLSEKALGLGLGRVLGLEKGGELRFSCIALAAST